MSGRDCNCHLDSVLLVRSCCSQTDECSSIFGMQAVRHAHWRTGLSRRRMGRWKISAAAYIDIERSATMNSEEGVQLALGFQQGRM